MNKNSENYKNALNQIHASEELKEKTFEKIKNKPNKKIIYLRNFTTIAAVFAIVFIGILQYQNNIKYIECPVESPDIATNENDLPRFKNMEELISVLQENVSVNSRMNREMAVTESVATFDFAAETEKSVKSDYSTTNVQVENVDEADNVKTDGEYIYYVTNNMVYIVEADKLDVISQIEYEEDNKRFSPTEIYINNNKLVVLGNYSEYETVNNSDNTEEVVTDYIDVKTKTAAKAIVYDISDKSEPKITREVGLDGYYTNSRMIGENLYFISTKSLYYYDNIEEVEILPYVQDSIMPKETKTIECTDIAYFKDSKSYSYMLVGGFNINNDEEVNVETFFGASDIVYASEKNLYITRTVYSDEYIVGKTEIYKFNLNNSDIILQSKGEVPGILNNQFSMDEYEDNLRLATTVTNITKQSEESIEEINGEPILSTTIAEIETENQIIILDENLNQIGKIEDMAIDEKIYAVRFIGKIGYVVTFKEIDPLFVIDLSEPTNPVVKGELKIPGYSSYLHPYDENHIIGIGYNTEENKYGGTINTNIKVSMFDISELESPKEMYSISVGEKYTSSELMNTHKALFYNENKNLIGFPYTFRGDTSNDDRNGLVLLKIDLGNGFEEYGNISNKVNYSTNINRAIYINDILYTLSNTEIISYDLNTIEKLDELTFE